MGRAYRKLSRVALKLGASLVTPLHLESHSVTRGDPAVTVMTDFLRVRPFTIEPGRSIQEANDKMIACGVRLLFVTDTQSEIAGLITATDILGEKPLKFISEHGVSRRDILVQDVMTPVNRLKAVAICDLNRANVDDVINMMRESGRQHMLVVEDENHAVRGIFSTSQIARQVGEAIEPPLRVNTFAELEKAIRSNS
jgi:CBS domain-containing protein